MLRIKSKSLLKNNKPMQTEEVPSQSNNEKPLSSFKLKSWIPYTIIKRKEKRREL